MANIEVMVDILLAAEEQARCEIDELGKAYNVNVDAKYIEDQDHEEAFVRVELTGPDADEVARLINTGR